MKEKGEAGEEKKKKKGKAAPPKASKENKEVLRAILTQGSVIVAEVLKMIVVFQKHLRREVLGNSALGEAGVVH